MTHTIKTQENDATASNEKLALYRRGETSFIDYVIEENEQLVTELRKEAVQPYLDKGYELIPDDMLGPLLYQAQIDTYVTDWREITEAQYEEYLNVLPPEKWEGDMFRMMEHTTCHITLHIAHYNGKYYAAEKVITATYDDYWRELSALEEQEA